MAVNHDIITIDSHYAGEPERAAVYLMIEDGEAAFIDNNTALAVPRLLDALKDQGMTPEQVRYLIVTHVHLDHSGGTEALLGHCPNATVIAHPKASRHLIDPSRLVQSVKQFYGEDWFTEHYGVIGPIDENRVQIVDDEETLPFGGRTLRFLHTRGHANHHISIYDDKSNAMFAGDSFGVAYPKLQQGTKPFVMWSSAPTDFDPDEARKSIRRIVDSGAERVYLTHYGPFNAIDEGASQLLKSVDALEEILDEAAGSELSGEALQDLCEKRLDAAIKLALEDSGVETNEAAQHWTKPDIRLNAMGLVYAAMRRRKAAQSGQ